MRERERVIKVDYFVDSLIFPQDLMDYLCGSERESVNVVLWVRVKW